jgi:hypothetical protein
MIIPEMENELAAVEMAREDQLTLERLFTKRRNLEIETNYLQRLLASLLGVDELVPAECNSSANPVLAVADASEKNIAATRQALDTLEIRERAVLERLAGQFNQRWGPLFKEGNGHSIFGEQVEAWACIYTSRVTNFLSYSPIQYFRAPPDLLPHER